MTQNNLIVALAIAILPPLTVIEKAHVVLESNMVLIFDNEESAKSLDTGYCFNAYSNHSDIRKIQRILSRGKLPTLEVTISKDFFQDASFGGDAMVHYFYRYGGRPLSNFCERNDLIVIKSVK